MAKDKEQEKMEATEEKPDENSIAAQLKKLGAELMNVADDEIGSKETLAKIDKLLGSLQIKDYPTLAESPVVQTLLNMVGVSGLKPGEVVNRGTLAEREREWTIRDVQDAVRDGRFRLVKFMPNENLQLTWNGLTFGVVADQECELPDVFYNVYKEHKFAAQQAAKNMDYMMGLSDQLPHENWQTPEAAVVRALSISGRRFGRVGGSITVGPINWMDGAPAGGGESDAG